MAGQFTSLVNSIGGLSLTDRTTELIGSASNFPRLTQQALVEAIRILIQSCEATLAHAERVQTLVESTHTPSDQGIVELSSLRRRVTDLAGITETFNDATERYIIAYITSLASPRTLVQKMLSHFSNELRSIARDVLNSTSDDKNVLRETLEMCYGQTLYASGTLHSDNYFIPLGEADLGWPYDPDFESEDYYEHEDRIVMDDGYAEAFRVRCERKSEKERQQREQWTEFWVQALSKCPDGPTLFYSPASYLPYYQFADVPRYLFRAFDYESSGRSDHYVVASAESISATSCRSRDDLLSRTAKEITRMLYGHLTKSCFGGEATDNLVSWSSSLLFVMQYAIWRCHQRHRDPAEIEICMVDTRKFPRGQFVRDMSLLRAYREAPEVEKKMRSFFNFRLENAYYDNGEYLSQGVLHHIGRSSVVSLAQLIQAGLHDLYPQFADPAAMDSWTKRVGFLRSEWSIEHTTTQLDIQKAIEMARTCFKSFDAPDVALLLLSFKNRKLRVPATKGTFLKISR
ncbi:hypothetical protein N7508_011085 [Penicillium antarcticum]|uniref:uncharacterized protein n=1 Tax=Penicillium antarcticum TaxID=416450 RepID=UPI0023A6161A|nr:uncharacterized protein N7508_011085 [Penicillium antarcticum]KAJ5288310.1 hypothetical protein N7508_011085 [Penicillium antarcticum]